MPAPTADQPADLLTISEAAELLRAPVATLRYWRHLGSGPQSLRLGAHTTPTRRPQKGRSRLSPADYSKRHLRWWKASLSRKTLVRRVSRGNF